MTLWLCWVYVARVVKAGRLHKLSLCKETRAAPVSDMGDSSQLQIAPLLAKVKPISKLVVPL